MFSVVSIRTQAAVTDGGTAAINAKLLSKMMPLFREETVEISSEGQRTSISCGKTTYAINCPPARDFPQQEAELANEAANDAAKITGICGIARKTAPFTGDASSKPEMQCVRLKLKGSAVHATASDCAKIMLVKGSGESSAELELLLPGRTLGMLAQVSEDSDMFDVALDGNQIIFDRRDMTFTARKTYAGAYMDTDGIIKNMKPAYAAISETAKIKEALDLMHVSAQAGRRIKPVNIRLLHGEILMGCDNDSSEASIAVPASISSETPEARFHYDTFALTKLFSLLSGKANLEIDARGIVMVRTASEVYMQAPMRMPEARAAENETENPAGTGGYQEAA